MPLLKVYNTRIKVYTIWTELKLYYISTFFIFKAKQKKQHNFVTSFRGIMCVCVCECLFSIQMFVTQSILYEPKICLYVE